MELTTRYCPNPHCTHYGKRGFGTHLVHRGADRGIPRLLCTWCDGTFSARQGTADALKKPRPKPKPGPVSVPEPDTNVLLLLGLGVTGLVAYGVHRRKRLA